MTLDCSKINLTKGTTSADVKTLQEMLSKLKYYTGRIDSYYGSITYKSVKKFQKDYKLVRDGIFGQITCKKLTEVYNEKFKPDTTKKENNKTTAKENKAVVKSSFKLNDDEPVTAVLTLLDEVVNLSDTEKTNAKNIKKNIISDNLTLSMNSDATGLTYEATLSVPYSSEYNIRKYQKAEVSLKNGDADLSEFTLKGYVNNIKLNHESDYFKLEISVVNYVEFLNKSIEDYNENCKRSEHCKKIAKLAGLEAIVDFTGLTDDVCTISAQAQKENEEGSNGESSGGTSGNGATKTLEEIYQMASGFKYGGIGTGLNPEKAWKAYENGGRTFDCYDCSNFLFYCLKNFAKIPCRIVQGYSPSSRSGTHRVVQIKTNGSWACPKQAWNLTRNLRPFTPEDKYPLTVKLSWEG